MGQGLARLPGDERCRELFAPAAAACHRCYRRLWTISRLPFDECGLTECGAGPACLPSAFEMNAGAKIWIWRPQADRLRFRWRRCFLRRSRGQTRSPALREAGLACGRRVAAFSRRVSLLGERNAVAATHIDHSDSFELGSDACTAGTACSTQLASFAPIAAKRAVVEHAHRRETLPQCSRRRAPPPGPYSASP